MFKPLGIHYDHNQKPQEQRKHTFLFISHLAKINTVMCNCAHYTDCQPVNFPATKEQQVPSPPPFPGKTMVPFTSYQSAPERPHLSGLNRLP